MSDIRLDQKELAVRWSISHRTLERWRVEGSGPAYLKIGGRVIYRIEDIEAYEAAQLHAPVTETRVGPSPTEHGQPGCIVYVENEPAWFARISESIRRGARRTGRRFKL